MESFCSRICEYSHSFYLLSSTKNLLRHLRWVITCYNVTLYEVFEVPDGSVVKASISGI